MRPRCRLSLAARLIAGLFVCAPFALCAQVPLATADRACELIGARLQSVDAGECKRLRLKVGDGASRSGMPLLYRDYPASSLRHTPSRVLMIGGIHGDELSSVSIAFQWMRQLAKERRPFHWRVIPSANPDGLFADPPGRINVRGVDLNRNFPSADWARNAHGYWKSRTGSDPRRYPGPSAASEPETRWLMAQIRQFRPDAIVSVHAPYGVLDYDGPLQPPERFGYLRLHTLGVYPGSLGNYAGIGLGLPVITLELSHAGIMPTPPQAERIWADMQRWLEQNLPIVEPPLYLRLQDTPWISP